MQILVLGFPEEQFTISVSDFDETTQESVIVETVKSWYRDFLDTVTQLQVKYNADEIIVTGPQVYIEQIQNKLEDFYKDDNEIVIMSYPLIKHWEEQE